MSQILSREEKRQIIHQIGADTEHVLQILLTLQRASKESYIDEDTAHLVADEVGLSYTRIYELLTFYDMLATKPQAEYVIEVCNNTPCYFSKSDRVIEMLREELDITVGETTADGKFAIRYTPCVGACDIGPVIKIKDDVYGNLTKEKVHTLLETLRGSK